MGCLPAATKGGQGVGGGGQKDGIKKKTRKGEVKVDKLKKNI